MAATAAAKATTTAEDTLARKSADPNIVSGGRLVAKALKAVWGKQPYFRREGGSIGSVVLLQKYVGADSLLTGFGLPDDNVHSPNERLHLPTWYKGIEAFTHFFYNFK